MATTTAGHLRGWLAVPFWNSAERRPRAFCRIAGALALVLTVPGIVYEAVVSPLELPLLVDGLGANTLYAAAAVALPLVTVMVGLVMSLVGIGMMKALERTNPAGALRNVTFVDVDITGSAKTGAFAGDNRQTIRNVSVNGTVSGDRATGGVAGVSYGNDGLYDSRAAVNVTGDFEVGGFVGISGAPVSRSYATGPVDASGANRVGGLVGRNRGVVTESYATGNVTGDDKVGGLVGLANDNSDIEQAYATGSVTGQDAVGGLVWDNDIGPINRTYAAGNVTGPTNVGGLVGNEGSSSDVVDSKWDNEATTQSASANGTGLTTADLTGDGPVSNTALDFGTTWQTYAEYPRLAWESDQLSVSGVESISVDVDMLGIVADGDGTVPLTVTGAEVDSPLPIRERGGTARITVAGQDSVRVYLDSDPATVAFDPTVIDETTDTGTTTLGITQDSASTTVRLVHEVRALEGGYVFLLFTDGSDRRRLDRLAAPLPEARRRTVT
jgi:hypothetical protein